MQENIENRPFNLWRRFSGPKSHNKQRLNTKQSECQVAKFDK